MSALIAAARLLTVLPLGRGASSQRATALAPAFFPLVGALVGGISAGVFYGAAQFLPVAVAAALAIAAAVIVTGALHIDGLADTADGLFGGRTPERRLEIMADPRVGSFGVAAIALVILVRWTSISSMTADEGWPVLMLAATASRFAAVPVMASFRYARQQGIGDVYAPRIRAALAAAAVIAVALVFTFGALTGLAAGAVGLATGLAAAVFANSRLNGVTGDVYGAVIEVTEVTVLLAAVAFIEADMAVQPVWEWIS